MPLFANDKHARGTSPMADANKDQKKQSRNGRKAPGKSTTRSGSGSKTSSPASKRAQPKAAGSSKAATKSMNLPTKARSAARSNTTSVARKSSAGAGGTGRGTASRRTQPQGNTSSGQNWLTSIETMITTREGREIMAEALRAVASVLDNRNERDQDSAGGGARQLGEVMDQGMLTSDPITNPAAAMVSGALGMAQAATEAVTDAATGVMLGGIGAADAGSDQNKSGRGAGKRRSSRKRTSSGDE